MSRAQPMTLAQIKAELRSGPYAWPGGYPRFFIACDGGALSFDAVRERWRDVVASALGDHRDGWRLAACDVNWEDSALVCDHTGKAIPSAYGDEAAA